MKIHEGVYGLFAEPLLGQERKKTNRPYSGKKSKSALSNRQPDGIESEFISAYLSSMGLGDGS